MIRKVTKDFSKIACSINSSKTEDHLNVCKKMLYLFSLKHPEEKTCSYILLSHINDKIKDLNLNELLC